eukprot:CAMPEP_0201929356 /NCGR_PEP_ID=MMETSP0903-20130614/22852_1 /ASSEMBLY_ACC=CAM_ASM_000552 /TAXON_ID=420261 /ORGANISM="Thalassiosira antarctica, Strain CCMP982" /LENGTH=497 /DNA_ID=CAMNT_0048468105 /DNA_START=9 /DNA_END=1499 /DNA_ORIENTATION=-
MKPSLYQHTIPQEKGATGSSNDEPSKTSSSKIVIILSAIAVLSLLVVTVLGIAHYFVLRPSIHSSVTELRQELKEITRLQLDEMREDQATFIKKLEEELTGLKVHLAGLDYQRSPQSSRDDESDYDDGSSVQDENLLECKDDQSTSDSEENTNNLPVMKDSDTTTNNEQDDDTTATALIQFDKKLLKRDCVRCIPGISIDGDTIVVVTKDAVQFFFNNKEGQSWNISKTIKLGQSHFKQSAISNNVAVVGAPTEDVAFLFEKDDESGEWSKVARITPKDDNGLDVKAKINFGFSVAVSGDVVVIGAPYDGEGMVGSAYIFRRSEEGIWVQEARVRPVDSKLKEFGSAVKIEGELIAVSDVLYGEDGNENGAVFLYEYDLPTRSWDRVQVKISNNDCDKFFGHSLAFTGTKDLFIGCSGQNNHAGAVFHYEHVAGKAFVFRQRIDGFNKFGSRNRLSADGNTMVVGTEGAKNTEQRVYQQVDGYWKEVAKIDSSPDGS